MQERDIDRKTVEDALRVVTQWVNKNGKYARVREKALHASFQLARDTGKNVTLESLEEHFKMSGYPFSISEWVAPGYNETLLEIEFKVGVKLSVVGGDARRGGHGRFEPKDIKRWFSEDRTGGRRRLIWLPAIYSGKDRATARVLFEDILAQAAWCLIYAGRAASDLEKFFAKYCEKYGIDMYSRGETSFDPSAPLFTSYQGHLSPQALRAYLSRGRPGSWKKHSGEISVKDGERGEHYTDKVVRLKKTATGRIILRDMAKESWPKGVPDTAQYLGVKVRTLYKAIEDGVVVCEVSWSGPQEKRYSFIDKKQADAAGKILEDLEAAKRPRRVVIAAYGEKRGISNHSARRWVERKEQAGLSLEEIARLVMGRG